MAVIKWNSQGEALLAKHQREAIEKSAPRGHLGQLTMQIPPHSEVDPRSGKFVETGEDGAAELWLGDKLVGNLVDEEPDED